MNLGGVKRTIEQARGTKPIALRRITTTITAKLGNQKSHKLSRAATLMCNV